MDIAQYRAAVKQIRQNNQKEVFELNAAARDGSLPAAELLVKVAESNAACKRLLLELQNAFAGGEKNKTPITKKKQDAKPVELLPAGVITKKRAAVKDENIKGD